MLMKLIERAIKTGDTKFVDSMTCAVSAGTLSAKYHRNLWQLRINWTGGQANSTLWGDEVVLALFNAADKSAEYSIDVSIDEYAGSYICIRHNGHRLFGYTDPCLLELLECAPMYIKYWLYCDVSVGTNHYGLIDIKAGGTNISINAALIPQALTDNVFEGYWIQLGERLPVLCIHTNMGRFILAQSYKSTIGDLVWTASVLSTDPTT